MDKRTETEKQQEIIERVAYEIYKKRELLGRPGNAQTDWQEAEQNVCSPQSIHHPLIKTFNRHLIWLEKHWFEPFSGHLERSAFFNLVVRLSPALEATGVLLIPLVLYLASQAYESQRDTQAIERLQQEQVQNYLSQLSEIFLNVEGDLRTDENQRVRAIAIAATITLFRDPNLDGQRKGQVIQFLSQMSLLQSSDYLDDNSAQEMPIIDLSGADLSGANLRNTDLSFTDFRGAHLHNAFLRDANFSFADFRGADLSGANFRNANLRDANFYKADLRDANLRNADLSNADLSNADLCGATLDNTNLSFANLSGASFCVGDLVYSDLCRTTLPYGIPHDPNRDCKKLNVDPGVKY